MIDDAIRRLRAKVLNMIGRAILTVVDDSAGHQKLQFTVLDDKDVRSGIHAQPFGVSFVPPVGAEGITLNPGGDTDNGFIICPLVPGQRPKGHQPGTGGLYYAGTFKVYLDSSGGVFLGSDTASHPMVLGDTLKTALEGLTVSTAFGPSGTPLNAATYGNFLSTKHKLDQ